MPQIDYDRFTCHRLTPAPDNSTELAPSPWGVGWGEGEFTMAKPEHFNHLSHTD